MSAPSRVDRPHAPVEPPPTAVASSRPVGAADDDGLVGVGADLEPGTLLAAYRAGLFPMPVRPAAPIGWWSPDPRGVLPLDGLRVSRSLRQSARRYEVRVDTALRRGDRGAAPTRAGTAAGSPPAFVARLRRGCTSSGWAHSVEAWTDDGELVGGLYGVRIGGLFAGESMFHRGTRRVEGGARRASSSGCGRRA